MKLTVREAARLLAIPESEVYRWVDGGDIPHHVVNHQPLFSRAELLEWATEHRLPVSIELFEGGGSLAAALERGGVHADVPGGERASTLRGIVGSLPISDPEERELVLAILGARDKEATTGIGDGVAIPDVRGPIVCAGAEAAIAVCYLDQPTAFDAIDDKPIETVFAMMTPTIRSHLQLLARLTLALHDVGLRDALGRRAPRDELLAEVARVEAGLAQARAAAPSHGDTSE